MKIGFYSKLAWEGISKNKRIYLPYMLTGCIMVMMFYILSYLEESPALQSMIGGSVLMIVLQLGSFVIAIFSILFLFYTNSFLIRQRYREFGLYNILGMDKKNICKIMIYETIFVGIIVIIIGLIAGVVMSKAAELLLLNILKMEVTFDLDISIKALWQTPLVYGVVYLLLLVYSFIRVLSAKPLELMQSNKMGEKVPKSNWIFAVVGLVFISVAYYLSVSIREPLTALLLFFIAVVMVIIGTYLIFISGSVVFCKMLQKNKAYYYKPNHFVSISSMVYRMKRNGAGLASICILLTMVLVMISSTCCLYFGMEYSLRKNYPYDVNLAITYDEIDGINDENINYLEKNIIENCNKDIDFNMRRSVRIPGLITKEGIIIDIQNVENFKISSYDNVGHISVISIDDYNKITDDNKVLLENECFIYSDRINYEWNSFNVEFGNKYKVKEILSEYTGDMDLNNVVMPTVYLVVDDLNSFCEPIENMTDKIEYSTIVYSLNGGFDTENVDEELEFTGILYETFSNIAQEDDSVEQINIRSRELQKESLLDLYGSLFFLGVMLSIVFLIAAILIIYYKQISEGYEDYARFDIMQKVGMTKRDIRKNINSQMLTVFFLPLILAGIHLAFAFPFITKIFRMFAFDNTILSIVVNIICFAVFGVLYGIVYKITSAAYYAIVSGERRI